MHPRRVLDHVADECDRRIAAGEQVLEVVEHEQQALLGQECVELFDCVTVAGQRCAQRTGDGRRQLAACCTDESDKGRAVGKRGASQCAMCRASRVLPMPPVPTSVTNGRRSSISNVSSSRHSSSAADERREGAWLARVGCRGRGGCRHRRRFRLLPSRPPPWAAHAMRMNSSRSCSGTCSTSASNSAVSHEGRRRPLSKNRMVWTETLTRSARASWVRSFWVRRA